ncbi:CpcD/allophycocyanin linker domain protein [Synechococcus sp. PCC 7335]|uniref:phycobilisome linker polypeptide n=1 Tax=Synechococcus sp. (strain ATCC 29403 / PCC 7335) TaxID=91464 RepID=UPI00017ECE10|nr:phycobilisome linker polypeptide [Synechococcus sp. PCC 7335]EDX85821.1 CpcD/allophycocyanin linker domain protein [Synechococcus sp. PCC 7335]
MLGQSATSTASSVDNRIFVYEVTGLSQNELTARQRSPIRSSQNQFVQVPFHRMNQEMRRITMLGGEIVRILPLGDSTKASPTPSESESPNETRSDEATKSSAN